MAVKLKKSSDITWYDLPKIESPFFAHSKVENSFYGRGHHDVWGLDEWKRDRCGYTNYTPEAQRDMLKRDIEWGNYYLVANPPFSPLFRWIEKEGKKGHWHVNAIGNIMIHSSAQMLARSARKPARTSTGYRPPVETPLKESDASKWQDHNSQPVAARKNEEKTRILQDGLWKEHDLFNDVAAGKENKLYRKGNTTRPHSKSEEVKLIQKALKKMDIDIGEAGVDGIYGNDGHYAVKIFQENYEPTHRTHKYAWSEPDGVVGKNTLLAMDEALVAGWKYKEPDYKKAPWIKIAESQIGVSEYAGKHSENPQIREYFKAGKYLWATDDSGAVNAWCGCFVAWVMKESGNPVTDKAFRAKSWAEYGKKINEPVHGAIGVKSRKGGGHTAFIVGKSKDGKYFYMLGGNQSDQVKVSKYRKEDWDTFVVPSDYNTTDAILPVYSKQASDANKES